MQKMGAMWETKGRWQTWIQGSGMAWAIKQSMTIETNREMDISFVFVALHGGTVVGHWGL